MEIPFLFVYEWFYVEEFDKNFICTAFHGYREVVMEFVLGL